MRILVTGGAGEMGRHAVHTLADDRFVEKILIADRDGERANALAAEVGHRASARALDITDAAALQAALRDADMVLNTVGPYYRYGRPVLEAAIEAGVAYADINDDWEPTLDMLELDRRAAEAGVTAVIGMGASPGVSNMLAAAALAEVDEAERIYTGWRAGGMPRPTPDNPNPPATAALEHWVHQCAAPIQVWRDGESTTTQALEELTITYPGRGEGSVWTCGHPEAITLPLVRPEVTECLNVMVSRPGLIEGMRRVVERVRNDELDVPAASAALLLEPDIRGKAAGEAAQFPNLFALVEGTKDGVARRVGVSANALPGPGMGEITGIPLAIIAGMIARGEVSHHGVRAPEAAVDPHLFFERLAQFADGPGDHDMLLDVAGEDVAPAA